ncbi:MAG TPA: Gfo/Idh/MocA family oxidoreductase [Pirellulaceae bacterium]|nr:Gfo/Idh/MocA family oxidoreductase [Pirellulaceae bacterium]
MSKRTRREFLESSMLVAAAAVAANSTGRLLAAEDAPVAKSANDKLGVAVVGVNGRGGSHIGAFAGRPDTEILYICDVDRDLGPKRCKEIAKRQNDREPQFVEDIRKLLEDPRVDIVSIATPNHWHSLGAIWSMQAGKDVYVEKPVSHNVSEGRRCVEAARKYNKICQTGTQSRSNPGMIAAIEYIQSGKIGDVHLARGLCYKRRKEIGAKGDYQVPANINYDLWTGPAPLAPLTRKQLHYDWHWQWAYGNGDLGNQGIHQMDLARWGLGVNELPTGVTSYGGRFGYTDAGETANTQVVVHDYGKKSLVFEVRGLETKPFKGAGVGVIWEGTDGYVVMSSYEAGAAFDKDGNKVQDFKGEGDHFKNFLGAVRSRKIKDLNADIEEGHLSSALCHLGNISYRLGEETSVADSVQKLESIKTTDNAKDTFERTIAHLRDNKVDLDTIKIGMGRSLTIDPKIEAFTGSDIDVANSMLTREYRAPFVVPAAGQV